MKLKEHPEKVRPFIWFGLHLDPGEQYDGDCPFCGSDRFYVDSKSGQWVCHKRSGDCPGSGNIQTFIRHYHALAVAAMPETGYDFKGLSKTTLQRFGVVKSPITDEWMIPYLSGNDGEIATVYRIVRFKDGPQTINCPGQPLYLFNLNNLSKDKERPLILLEGPSDLMALDQWLRENKRRKEFDLLAPPSANTFKPQWLKYLKGRDVRIVFDHDPAGMQGQDRIVQMIAESKVRPALLSKLVWPDYTPKRYDVRDLVQHGEPDANAELIDDDRTDAIASKFFGNGKA